MSEDVKHMKCICQTGRLQLWSCASLRGCLYVVVARPKHYPPPPRVVPFASVTLQVWYYIDVRDAVQGPFSGREMTGWVASGMLKEDTRACGADPGAGVSQLVAGVRGAVTVREMC
jgi:hypothetical protein